MVDIGAMGAFLKDLAQFLRDVGFPVAVSCYALVRIDRTLTQLVKETASLHGEMRAWHSSRTYDKAV